MAITKIGIDYYPRDVGMMRDRKFNRARQKYGYVTYVIYDALLEMIYRDKGYYIRYDEKTRDEVIWELQDYCKGKYPVEGQTVSEVIEMLVASGLFSGDHFKQGIITSRRIQETYYRVTVERRKAAVDFKIWMLSLEEMKAISSRSVILQQAEVQANIGGTSGEYQTGKEENQPNKEENQPNREQSKGKEIKSKENILNNIISKSEKERTVEKPAAHDVDIVDNNIKRAYRQCFHTILDNTSSDYMLIVEWLNVFDSELICEALRLSMGKDNIAYTKGILSNWYKEGITDYIGYLFGKGGGDNE